MNVNEVNGIHNLMIAGALTCLPAGRCKKDWNAFSPDTLGARLTDSVGAVGENAEPVSAPPLPPSADRMGYVADLLQELQQMAEREGRSTLAGLLALTVAEARQAAARW